jgi:hypothetical protein
VSGHDTRTDLAAALAGLEGVTAMAYAPAVPVPGMAWPVWVSTEPLTGCAWSWTYDVLYVLAGGDLAGAAAAAESVVVPIADRLTEIGEVVSIEPVTITLDAAGGSLPGVRFRVTTS